jgi:hypothetical protein
MSLRTIALLLVAALATLAPARPVLAETNAGRADAPAASLPARVRDGVRKLGTGPDARISVRRRDGKKVKGYVAAAGDAGFTVVTKSGGTAQVRYDDVTQAKGQNLSTGWKIAIGAGIGVGVFFLVLYIFLATQTR